MSSVANTPRTNITWPMFMDCATDLVIASLAVNPAMDSDMNRAARRFVESGKGVSRDFSAKP